MNLTIKNLSKSFDISRGPFFRSEGKVHALSDINVTLEQGTCLGVVGESGSGKTTLAKILAGFLEADQGSAKYGEHDLLELGRKERSNLAQMIFQDPFASLNPKLLLGTQLHEALASNSHKMKVADQLMNDVGLPAEFLARYPHQLSGGQRQRFVIARALAKDPKLLLSDEPVSSLDLSIQAQIINLLNDLRIKKKFTHIVISHDLTVIANLCEQVVVLKEGLMVETGSVDQILSTPQHDYTKRLLNAVPVV